MTILMREIFHLIFEIIKFFLLSRMQKNKSGVTIHKQKQSGQKKGSHLVKNLCEEKAQNNRPIQGHTRPHNRKGNEGIDYRSYWD